MRVIFNEEMKAVADDLDRMALLVRKAIHDSGDALLNQDVEAAQAVLDGDIEIDALESSVIDQCVRLLARQTPVATDLRVVVSTMRLATTFERMGDLARHIAAAARRTYPQSPLPSEAVDLFKQMQDILDNLHHQTFKLVLSDSWSGTRQQLVDVVLLGRFMERLGDHAVSVARRVVYIVSGFDPSKVPARDEDSID